MEFSSPIFIICISTGIIFILTGFLTQRFPPKQINNIYGYRTKSSKKSKERWDFAQAYSSTLMIKLGIVLCFISALGLVVYFEEIVSVLMALIFILLIAITLVWRTENALKNKFGDD